MFVLLDDLIPHFSENKCEVKTERYVCIDVMLRI